jgi:hypothetical protein
MFLRVVRASGGKGVKHEYLRLVEAYRDHDGKTQHRTVLNLGRMDLLATHLDLDKLDRLLHGEARPAQSLHGEKIEALAAWALCVNDDETAILPRFRVEGAKEKPHGHPQPYGAIAFDS